MAWETAKLCLEQFLPSYRKVRASLIFRNKIRSNSIHHHLWPWTSPEQQWPACTGPGPGGPWCCRWHCRGLGASSGVSVSSSLKEGLADQWYYLDSSRSMQAVQKIHPWLLLVLRDSYLISRKIWKPKESFNCLIFILILTLFLEFISILFVPVFILLGSVYKW